MLWVVLVELGEGVVGEVFWCFFGVCYVVFDMDVVVGFECVYFCLVYVFVGGCLVYFV